MPRLPTSPVRWTALALSLATFCLFIPTLNSGFVWDAIIIILQLPFIHDPANWLPVLTFQVMSMDVIDFNRPVHLASLMLDAAIWGRNPFGYHLTSNLLHAINTALVFFVILRTLAAGDESLSRTRPGPSKEKIFSAAFGSLLFAWHPVQCEAVCEPTFREDLQVVFFSLAALLLAIRGGGGASSLDGKKPRLPPWSRIAVCWALCFLAVGSKESGMAATGLLAAWAVLFEPRSRWRYWALLVAGAFAVSALFLAYRFAMEKPDSVFFSVKPVQPGGSAVSAVLVFPRILLAYFGNLLDPSRLSADYQFEAIRAPGLAASWIVFTMLAATLSFLAWRSRRGAFGIALFSIPLLFVSNLVPIYSPMADRHLYFPMTGLGMLAATGLAALLCPLPPSSRRPVVAVGVAASLALWLAFGSFERQKVWESPETLFLDTISKNPESFVAHGVYATALATAGDKEKALQHTLQAIPLMHDGSPKLRLTAAKYLFELGRMDEAAAMLQTIEILPEEEFTHRIHLYDIALLHDLLGSPAAARAAYSRYLAVVPNDPRAMNNLAWLMATDPQATPAEKAQALDMAWRAVNIDASARHNQGTLAVALLVNGDISQGRPLAEKTIARARNEGDEKSAMLLESWLLKTAPAED
jgi:tetratricopeptide (TPR) repeat protein